MLIVVGLRLCSFRPRNYTPRKTHQRADLYDAIDWPPSSAAVCPAGSAPYGRSTSFQTSSSQVTHHAIMQQQTCRSKICLVIRLSLCGQACALNLASKATEQIGSRNHSFTLSYADANSATLALTDAMVDPQARSEDSLIPVPATTRSPRFFTIKCTKIIICMTFTSLFYKCV